MEYYRAVKKNMVLLHTTQWMELKNMVVRGKSWTEKTTHYEIPSM